MGRGKPISAWARLTMVTAVLLSAGPPCHAEHYWHDWDLPSYFSIRGDIGPVFALGDKTVLRHSRVGPAVGGSFVLHLSERVRPMFIYDRLDLGPTLQAEVFLGGLMLRAPLAGGYWLFLQGGLGRGRTNPSDRINKMAFKAGIGLERYFTNNTSLGAVINYHYIDLGGTSVCPCRFRVSAITPALNVSFRFGPSDSN